MSYHRLIITLKYLQPIHFLALRSPAPGGGSPSPSSTIRIVSSNHLPLSARVGRRLLGHRLRTRGASRLPAARRPAAGHPHRVCAEGAPPPVD